MYPINNLRPPYRKLRGYAFDPSLSLKIDTVDINNIVYKVYWEEGLEPGPIGEYVEVIDYDPTVKMYYTPVDLNDNYILAQDGLDPSESNPQFHQQMVYAVIMTTIKNFEKAMGRPVMWSTRLIDTNFGTGKPKKINSEYVPRLRVYPHALREANAYYDPQKKALLFGYFYSNPASVTLQMPHQQVFTCLSHDIITHETTHAILDGVYNNYIYDTNPDMLSFQEAFADIVALFQHFSFPEVLKNQIARTRGDLSSQNLLGKLAQEFGAAIGNYDALRDAIGYIDPETNEWKPRVPNGEEYQTTFEPHARGSILVSAVFEAFLTIYKNRVADLLRIATGGTGILPQGELHPDLVNRMAIEASKSASHILNMCIRALDYCPPIDLTFGDYLRAIITSDTDLVADDSRDYRLAFIDAFRKRGIYPSDIKSLSVESLCFKKCEYSPDADKVIKKLDEFLGKFSHDIVYVKDRSKIHEITRNYIASNFENKKKPIYGLHRRLLENFVSGPEFEKITGLVFTDEWENLGIKTSHVYKKGAPSVSIQGLRFSSRVGPSGKKIDQVIISLTQKAGIEVKEPEGTDKRNIGLEHIETFQPYDDFESTSNKFYLYGGATLIFDLSTGELKYAITKPLIDPESADKTTSINKRRALELYRYYNNLYSKPGNFRSYFSRGKQFSTLESFSFLHIH